MDLLKESGCKFRYYASGRRHVEGCLVTLDLRPRQDLLMGYIVNALMPQDDIIDFEVCPAHPVSFAGTQVGQSQHEDGLHVMRFPIPGQASTLRLTVNEFTSMAA